MATIIGGFLFRMGIGALPFLLPLLLQVGFHYTPFQSGLTTFSSTVGAFTMKTLASRILKRFGYMVWDRDGAKWKGSLFDEDGEQIAHCKLAERSLTCKKEH